MKTAIIVACLAVASLAAQASEQRVLFSVTETTDGVVTAHPSFLAAVGQTAAVRLPDGMFVEALTNSPEADGHAWTKVRITYFEASDSRFVQETSMRHTLGEGGSIEFTEPSRHKHFEVVVRQPPKAAPALPQKGP